MRPVGLPSRQRGSMPSEENFDMMKWGASGRGESEAKKKGRRESECCQSAVKIARHSKLFQREHDVRSISLATSPSLQLLLVLQFLDAALRLQ